MATRTIRVITGTNNETTNETTATTGGAEKVEYRQLNESSRQIRGYGAAKDEPVSVKRVGSTF